jgi:uncharacterized protein (TIGR02284 family)
VSAGPDAFRADGGDETAATLNRLIQTCKDGEHGFRAAADVVNDSNLRRLFESYSQQRAEFGAELQLEVRRMAEDPVQSGHMTAALHRTWMDLKAGVTGWDEGMIIAECERGEDIALANYENALGSGLSAELRDLVERQFLQIKDAQAQLRSLERAHSRHG